MTNISHIAQVAVKLNGVPEALPKAATPVRDRQELAAPGKPAIGGGEAKPDEAGPDVPTTAAAVVKLNEYLQQERRTLQFSVDQASGRTVITITDSETDEVIRQIPPERVLAIMRSFAEGPSDVEHRGLLVRETV